MARQFRRRTIPLWWQRIFLALIDAGAWAAALATAAWLRYEFDFDEIDRPGLLMMTAVAVAVVWITGTATRTYGGRYAAGSLDEALHLARVAIVTALVLFALDVVLASPPVPRSVPLTAALLALALSLGARLVVRGHSARKARPDLSSARRAIVYGAGARGRELVRGMLVGAAGATLPVALLDDDPAVRHHRVCGVAVRGTGARLAAVACETDAQLLIIAFPYPDPDRMRSILAVAKQAELQVKILPPLTEQFLPWTRFSDLRDLNVADLLGRQQIDTDLESIAGNLTGRRVLVTGAGGSIGSELCRQIHKFAPSELLMLDRDESALHAVQLSIHAEARMDSPNVILGDLRDTETILGVLLDRRPDVVFHAAALKHLTVLERHPEEAWKTNVLGTMGILEAARAAGVSRFVNISTDKAANPRSVLGRSKRIGERLVADAAAKTDGTFLSVRFGNVLGSRGSVLSTFAGQLAAGHPITVTHPEVTRFFMTVPEAVQLVIQAAAIGSSGEALVLDMGKPARITDLAEMLMAISGHHTKIVFTGLGKGEKLHEELFGAGETDHRPIHPAISHIRVPALSAETVLATSAELGAPRR